MARTTHRQIEALFAHVKAAGVAAGVPHAETWQLDYAPHYGGWCVELRGGSDSLGSAMMDANRMPAGEFYRALRILHDVLEALAP